MVLQHVQDLGGVAVLISAVKGEVEDLLGRVPHIVGVVLGQGLGGGVAHRGFPSVWKDRPQLSVEAATAAGAAAGTGVSSRTASQNSPPSTRQSAAADSSAVRRVVHRCSLLRVFGQVSARMCRREAKYVPLMLEKKAERRPSGRRSAWSQAAFLTDLCLPVGHCGPHPLSTLHPEQGDRRAHGPAGGNGPPDGVGAEGVR